MNKSHADFQEDGYSFINVRIKEQGSVALIEDGEEGKLYNNLFWIVAEGEDVVVVETTMKTKYANIGAYITLGDTLAGSKKGYPGIVLDCDENTIKLDDRFDKDKWTWVEFPTLIGYSCRGTQTGRYTITLTFVKDKT